ncbi:MAG TPA: NADH-quinone oxidoreductase subunit NuoH [Syntrophorhabdaceae bacterium]|mgnify:FL=1|nr:NADH-quinone oxidoreductase subunit NuoH [Syntrophorhabdaceae bacterium]HOF58265.1 NADH-quinone oxidoreductase subunit NuoH [Syntrophorhabdaceae bacterium]HOS06234.1 NADH-quinone oxidoreductase subunit NuoH [Syntrophorhabdaceae bacterium]HPH42320.1 NADH-quinone oxidoreductase subunit NuoH [Syntrophorhabdaceae bacterium]HPL41640.1 NADH-quinone oxidoreductase subunit NuoH [Syntrophorhabdaceae bacterium]
MNELKCIISIIGEETTRAVIGLVGVMILVVVNALILTWAERKVAGHMQRRIAAKEVGPFGLIQPIADSLKLLCKELITPHHAERPLFYLAPTLIFLPVLVSFVVIPFDAYLQVKDINVGILVILAFSSLSVLSILIAGWGSNNKYSLIGSIRSVAQNIAYEIPLLLSLLPIIIIAQSFSLRDIVEAQKGLWFVVYQPFAFLIFFTASVAETNRTPFDLPEAESELVAGFHTEYSGMRFALFFLAEYTNIFIVSAIATTFFLGGYNGPILPGIIWFFIKTYFLVFVILWMRWTFPRVRFDQLLNLSWKILIPVALVNLIVTGGILKL